MTRYIIALLVIPPILALGFGTILVPQAEHVFDKLVPSLTLVLGYYFGATRERE
jgi:hypothetical protein